MKKLIYISILLFGLNFTSSAQNDDPARNQSRLLNFYPNPATSAINFDFQRGYDKSHSIVIFNFMGKQVMDIKNLNQRTNLRLDELYRGIYIFQLRDRNGVILQTGKFQVIK